MSSIRLAVPERRRKSDSNTFSSTLEMLARQGFEIRRFTGEPWRAELGDVMLIRGNVNWFPSVKRQLYETPRDKLPAIVVWHLEPLPPSPGSGQAWPWLDHREIAKLLIRSPRATDPYTNYWVLRRLHRRGLPDWLFASSAERVEFLEAKGIPAEHLPMGYLPVLGRDLGLQRDIGVLFLGAATLRRSILIARLRRLGVNLTVRGGWHNPECWGDSRTRLINRTKVFLNLPRFAGQFALLRFVLGAANKALIVSEPLYNSAPFVAGQHYVAATYREMPRVIRYYLEHEDERRRIAENGYHLTMEKCLMSHSVDRLAECIRRLVEARRP
jgi:hypothetical protein